MSGYSQAKARMTRLKRGIPVLWRWLKHALAGMMRRRSFSICLFVINASLLEAFTISLYMISDEHFFWSAPIIKKYTLMKLNWLCLFLILMLIPDMRIQICGLKEWGMPCRTISRSLSVRGNLRSIFCHESSATSLLWLNSKRATHCNLKGIN